MVRSLSLRELRQNPTEAIDAVEAGEVIVITRHNRPIADLVPHTPRSGATPSEVADLLGRTPVDQDWSRELREGRTRETRDVWVDER